VFCADTLRPGFGERARVQEVRSARPAEAGAWSRRKPASLLLRSLVLGVLGVLRGGLLRLPWATCARALLGLRACYGWAWSAFGLASLGFLRLSLSLRLSISLRVGLSLVLGFCLYSADSFAEERAGLGADVVSALAKVPRGALVVFAPLQSDIETSRGEELARLVAYSVSARLEGSTVHTTPLSKSAGAAAAVRFGAWVWVQSEVRKGELRLTVDAYPVVKNSWERLRQAVHAPVAHGFAARPIDAEIRSFFPPILLEQAKVTRVAHDEGEILAIACGDLDGDGGLEVALATAQRITVGRFRKEAFVVEQSVPWSGLGKRAAVSLREPLVNLVFMHDTSNTSFLLAGSTNFGGARLGPSFQHFGPEMRGVPFLLGSDVRCATALPESGALDGIFGECASPEPRSGTQAKEATQASQPNHGEAKREAPDLWAPPAAYFDAFAALDLIQRDGTHSAVVAAREPNGRLRLRRGATAQVVEQMGAQLALGDLDLDGTPEIVTSLNVTNDADDAILVLSWAPSGMRQRARIAAPGGVRALAVCPPEEGARPAWVAAVGRGARATSSEATSNASAGRKKPLANDPGGNEVWLVR
jgi:hypothetical protein